MIYPSKKIAVVFFVILFLTGGWFYFAKFKKPKISQRFLENIAEKAKSADSDNDGLKDWEEILLKISKISTDNSDSDKEIVFAPELQSNASLNLNLTQELAKGMGSKIFNASKNTDSDFSNPFN